MNIRVYTTNKNFLDRLSKFDLKENAGLDLYLDISRGIDAVYFSNEEVKKPEVYLNENILKITPIAGFTSYPFLMFVRTGLYLELPAGVHAIVMGRSGRFFRDYLDVFRGVIDSSYRGEIVVGMIVYRKQPLYIDVRNAIAQLVFLDNRQIQNLKIEVVDSLEELAPSSRGAKGFGSSDVVR